MDHAKVSGPERPLAFAQGLQLSQVVPLALRPTGDPVHGQMPANPADVAQTSEICACCNGVLDIDELVGLLPLTNSSQVPPKAAPQPPAAQRGSGWGRLPSLGEVASTAGKAYLALPGGIFGLQNMQGAQAAAVDMAQLSRFIDQRTAAWQQHADPVGRHDALANLAAYRDTALHSRSMQRFIYWFAGLLSVVQSAAMVAAIALPAMEPVGSLLLAVYAGSFAVRYCLYERPRLAAAAAADSGPQPCRLVEEGARAVRDKAVYRQALFQRASGLFLVYAAGALLSAAPAVLPAAAAMATASVIALLVGTLSVSYLNNWPIKDTFGKNQDLHVDREGLGDMASVYRRIGYVQGQLRSLEAFDRELAALPFGLAERCRRVGDAAIEAAMTVLSYGSFGLVSGPRQLWQHNKQIRELAHCEELAKNALQGLQRALAALAAGAAASAHLPSSPVEDDILAFIEASEAAALAASRDAPQLQACGGHRAPAQPEAGGQQEQPRVAPGPHGHAAHGPEDGHGCGQGHSHEHCQTIASAPAELATLHGVRYGMVTRKRYELGALLDHAQARLRLEHAGAAASLQGASQRQPAAL